eukprot:10855405-Alexandrium_andersonii.AAC.1
MAAMVVPSSSTLLFLMMVTMNRFSLVVPWPTKEFQLSTIMPSYWLKAPPSPCKPMGVTLE